MPHRTRTLVGSTSQQQVEAQLLDRLRSQFPELSHHEVADAAAGVIALPDVEPVVVRVAATSPPRHRA